MMKTVWHYTSISALQEIKRTQKFYPSKFKQTDTMYGEGWYFTDLPPSTPVFDLCEYLWTDHSISTQEKTKCYIKYEIDNGLLTYCREHVYLLPFNIIVGDFLDLGKSYHDNNNTVIRFIGTA